MRVEDFAPNAPGRLVSTLDGLPAFVPDPLPPDLEWTSRTLGLLADAAGSLGELKGIGRTLPNPHLLIGPFLRREAVLSNRIEGTTTGIAQLALFEAAAGAIAEQAEAREVLNYVFALEYGIARLASLPVSLRLICEIHQRLMQGVRGQDRRPGEFRQQQNAIGRLGATAREYRFVPPPVQEMLLALHAFETYIGAAEPEPPVLIQLALIHYQFETIHPFMDGNGRIGRLLIPLLLQERGLLTQPLLYLSDYFERHRDEYKDLLLRVSQVNDWTGWVDFFLLGIAVQARDAVARSERLLGLWRQYRDDLQATSSSTNLLRLVDLLFERPAVTVRDVATALSLTPKSANLLVDRLVNRSILREATGRSYNRVFLADAIIGIIESAS